MARVSGCKSGTAGVRSFGAKSVRHSEGARKAAAARIHSVLEPLRNFNRQPEPHLSTSKRSNLSSHALPPVQLAPSPYPSTDDVTRSPLKLRKQQLQ
jgi:hypothetical protein